MTMIFGIELQPFSWGRRAALQRLLRDEMSFAETALLVVYLCTKTPGQIDAIRGDDAKRAFRLEMEQWADEHQIISESPNEKLLIDTADEIYKAYTDAQFETQSKASPGSPPGNVLG